ncbi:GMC family oxidoreductase N-terminal domain-containing protein [Cnuibacter physcomitrellae]|uniref:GMC family oxidoreductase N-terminal domain-containing protein n=1 Tax=Cnuibacter physcomitrellae TaxID=1619308 RepID=UPI0021759C80|nr:GMC family oxidoreductase N-terminal domain-containing protein [Cnuibacter physcomitrellae]MCS5498819.1 GMC family oxidoreductase N-terminal domain-containing protein [Cnuibacter physcomitrellae]
MILADVVVVGAGGSGAPLAARLAEGGIDVVLVEAGRVPSDRGHFGDDLLDAGRLRGAHPSHPDTWAHPARLTTGRDYTVIRGRVAGGSTTTNGGYFVRPTAADVARWTARAPEWSPDVVRAAMIRLERDLDFGAVPGHGDAGPMPVSRPDPTHPVSQAFVRAALAQGMRWIPDGNVDDGEGVGPLPMDVVDGVRWNTALGYLLGDAPFRAERRGRPRVVQGTVRHVVLRAGRARGVELLRDGGAERVEADEVVLSAGAFASPQLLMRSGIGPAALLEAAALPVVHDSPGVGAAFSDHPQIPLDWWPKVALPTDSPTAMAVVAHTGTAEILPLLAPVPVLLGGAGSARPHPFTTLVSLSRARSRGTIKPAAGRGGEGFAIDYRYLEDPLDRADLREAVRATSALHESAAFTEVSAGATDLPARTLDGDTALDAWILDHLGTSVHACGSAPMGPPTDPGSVVDGLGRVYGVKGLRIADTSILPEAPSRGPAYSAVVIGEVLAALMLRG